MVIIESTAFTADVADLLTEAEYRAFQEYLVVSPKAGAVIADTGGLRKVRWSAGGKGKRGGVRVIYYHLSAASQLRLLLIYSKGTKDDLTPRQKAMLRKLNEGW